MWPFKKKYPHPQQTPDFFSQGDRNRVLEEAAKIADLRARVFGGEPTTRNEQQIVEHIAAAIRALKWQSFS